MSRNQIDLNLIKLVEGEAQESLPFESYNPVLYKDAKKKVLDSFSKTYPDQLLTVTKGNISEAARVSGLKRASIQKIVKRLNIDMSDYRQ